MCFYWFISIFFFILASFSLLASWCKTICNKAVWKKKKKRQKQFKVTKGIMLILILFHTFFSRVSFCPHIPRLHSKCFPLPVILQRVEPSIILMYPVLRSHIRWPIRWQQRNTLVYNHLQNISYFHSCLFRSLKLETKIFISLALWQRFFSKISPPFPSMGPGNLKLGIVWMCSILKPGISLNNIETTLMAKSSVEQYFTYITPLYQQLQSQG